MARGLVRDLPSAAPLTSTLPAVFQEDDFAQRFTSALDEVLAPVFSTLDNLHAYVDPDLVPSDFLWWLAGWVGITLDENWSQERQRAFVAQAAEIFAKRGTARGLAAEVELYTGALPEITENGAVGWSAHPDGTLPGDAQPLVVVSEIGRAHV